MRNKCLNVRNPYLNEKNPSLITIVEKRVNEILKSLTIYKSREKIKNNFIRSIKDR